MASRLLLHPSMVNTALSSSPPQRSVPLCPVETHILFTSDLVWLKPKSHNEAWGTIWTYLFYRVHPELFRIDSLICRCHILRPTRDIHVKGLVFWPLLSSQFQK